MTVKSLVDAWAREQGLAEQEVLSAVREHMFDEKRGPGHLRFSLNTDAAGNTLIRVTPKRGTGGPVATPARSQWESKPARSQWEPQRQTGPDEKQQQESGPPESAPEPSVRESHSWGSRSRDDGEWRGREAYPRQRSWRSGSGGGWHKRGTGEAVQRWLAWALASGYRELRVRLRDMGRARLDDLAVALGRSRPDLGISDEAGLRALLEETDLAGRFEVDNEGCVHKVHRDARRPRLAPRASSVPAPPAPPAAPAAPAAARAPSPPPGDHWKKFTDGGTLWWYYEGPLGKWWCTDEKKELQEVSEDDASA